MSHTFLDKSSPLFLPCLKRLVVTRSDDDYSLLFTYLAVNSTIVDLVITIGKWKPSEVEKLTEMFSANSTLKKVELKNECGGGHKDLNLEPIFHGLSRNKSIIKLDLSLFPICDPVYFSILLRNNTIRALVYPRNLKTLDSTVISSFNRNSALQELFLNFYEFELNNFSELLKIYSIKKTDDMWVYWLDFTFF
ncbi:hypothetical protein GEMRC1_010390 [Eukaryota sp. GEM-RC1]